MAKKPITPAEINAANKGYWENLEKHSDVARGQWIKEIDDRVMASSAEGMRYIILRAEILHLGQALESGIFSEDLLVEGKRELARKIEELQIVKSVGEAAYQRALSEVTPYERRLADLAASHQGTNKSRASKAGAASHVRHAENKAKARAWYAENATMTKDAAAEAIIDAKIVHASFRTVRDYLKGQ